MQVSVITLRSSQSLTFWSKQFHSCCYCLCHVLIIIIVIIILSIIVIIIVMLIIVVIIIFMLIVIVTDCGVATHF